MVLEAKMILWAYIFVVYSSYLNTMYIKLNNFQRYKNPKIHKNLNP